MNADKIILESNSPDETGDIAYRFGKGLSSGDVICLDGDLGAGKTAFTKGLVKAFGVFDDVTSPTFTIVNEYEGTIPIYHFDVYRIEDSDEMFEIGFDEYIYGDGISVIEWADKIKEVLPSSYIQVIIKKDLDKDDDYRKISFCAVGDKYKKFCIDDGHWNILRRGE